MGNTKSDEEGSFGGFLAAFAIVAVIAYGIYQAISHIETTTYSLSDDEWNCTQVYVIQEMGPRKEECVQYTKEVKP
jgi:hypothetical protein